MDEIDKCCNDRYLKELEFIQRCVDRMANNSFKIKRWMSSTLIIVFGVGFVTERTLSVVSCFAIIVLISTLCMMDGYYLAMEKTYRRRYEAVVKLGKNTKQRYGEDMSTIFILNPNMISSNGTIDGEKLDETEVTNGKNTKIWIHTIKCVLTKTVIPFYLTAVILVVMILIFQ